MDISLYIHFPFCLRKCLYCDFNSLAGSRIAPDAYVAAVVREMELRAERLPASAAAPTLYFGGGTPSLMEPDQVARLIEAAAKLFGLMDDAEVTIEANPGTLTLEKLAGYRAAGVNRLSLGVQSFSDEMLVFLGRVHTAREALDSFAAARAAGFANIGIDLIHSVPGETPAGWREELAQAVRLGPEHISAYALTVEEGTPFHLLEKEGQLPLPDEEEGVAMFRDTAALLRAAGYEHYEISNFARPGFRSRHNQLYWQRGNCLGFGAGAHSFLRSPAYGVRWRNSLSPEAYLQAVSRAVLAEEELTPLAERDAMAEFFFLGLRLLDGVAPAQFCREFGITVEEAYPGVLAQLLAEGLVETREGFVRLTGRGLDLANQVFVRFL
ncbi:MAG: radical SAM family heme chaperone HemW [Geobacteraceae bacterium]|nr:radical SAM family heme chaperone HemW [Geobacteraceae bacterium]